MKILTAAQIRDADAYTIAHEPVSSVNLMERAATACFGWIAAKFNKEHSFRIFCGVGNNGGDGLVIGRKLIENGFNAEIFIIRFSEKCSEDFLVNEERLRAMGIPIKNISVNDEIINPETQFLIPESAICIDAIFGSGLSRPVTGLAAEVIKKINSSGSAIISIDVPSGLFCEDNSSNIRENIIRADFTLTFECPKLSFLFPENAENTGEWTIIPIGLDKNFIAGIPCKTFFLTQAEVAGLLKPRKKFSHKGTYGHALLLCGSYGKMGAAVLATHACLRAGAGLVTAHIPKCGYNIIQTALPEAMTSMDESEQFISTLLRLEKYNAVGAGPGIGMEKQTQNVIKLLIQNSKVPLVIDADALNILAENKTWLSFLPPATILTPHPKEFERLAGKFSNDFDMFQIQTEFARKFRCYVVLKGAHTCIACPGGEVFFNSTGNPGMATGGSGDVLTGILTGLLAQGYSSGNACTIGVYLHGLAGDIAAEENSMEALIAGDIVKNLGKAFLKLYC